MSGFGHPPGTNNPDGMPKGTTHEGIRCPRCGEKFGNLPNHLPGCDGE